MVDFILKKQTFLESACPVSVGGVILEETTPTYIE